MEPTIAGPTKTSSGKLESFNYEKWNGQVAELARQYQNAAPFPHIHLKEFFRPAAAKSILEGFPSPNDLAWTQYRHLNSKKLGHSNLDQFSPALRAAVNECLEPRFLEWLSKLTGIEGLIADPALEAGGMHQSIKGGFLNVHTDFNRHYRNPNWERRLNLLVYFNEDWKDEWKGHLELWDKNMTRAERKIAPLFNHAVIFSTTEDSYHGHPDPMLCPEGVTRKSLALYYYTLLQDDAPKSRGTNYKFRPQDGAGARAFLWMDKVALGFYHSLRIKLKFSDGVFSKIIKSLKLK